MIDSAALNGIYNNFLRLLVCIRLGLFNQLAVKLCYIDLDVILYLLVQVFLRLVRCHAGHFL